MDFRLVPSDHVCLPSCHTLIRKQDSTIKALGSNRWVIGGRSRDENHASDLDREQRIAVERGTRSRSEASLTSLQGGAIVGTLWLLEEDMGRRSTLSEYMSLHPSLTNHRNVNPLENKVWEIYFIKKCVRSFIEVRKLCLIMFPLVYLYGYTTNKAKYIFYIWNLFP